MSAADVEYDPRAELREEIFARLGMASNYIGLARRFAEIGDDAGLRYSMVSLLSYVKIAGEAFVDLDEANGRGDA